MVAHSGSDCVLKEAEVAELSDLTTNRQIEYLRVKLRKDFSFSYCKLPHNSVSPRLRPHFNNAVIVFRTMHQSLGISRFALHVQFHGSPFLVPARLEVECPQALRYGNEEVPLRKVDAGT
jgi:hypothetical protein